MSTILRTENESGVLYDLDVYNEQDFLLDISAIESGDVGKVFGISSQTFALPPTKTNDEYFGNLYDLGASGEVSFIKTQPCQVINDGQAIFSGRLYLENVVTNQHGDTIYNVVVTNETVDFKFAIESLTFGDLDWSDYNHNLTYANVSSSWGNNLFGGDVVYPLVDYGNQSKDVQSSLLESGGNPNTFTNASTPMRLDQFKPAVRLNTVLDKIFETVGYSYTSSFFESAYADSIYVLATKDSEKGATTLNPISQSFYAYNGGGQDINFGFGYGIGNYGVPFKVEFINEEYDNASRWDQGLSEFTAGEDGQYSFSGQLGLFFVTGSVFNDPKTIELDVFINGSPSTVPTVYYNLRNYQDGNTTTLNFNFANIQLAVNDVVTLRATRYGPSNQHLAFLGGSGIVEKTTSYFQMYQGPQTVIGGNVNLAGNFMPEENVLDFLNGVIQKFNIVIEPLSEEKKTLQVETFNDWVDKGAVVDWTNKVDRSVKFEIRHPLQDGPKNIYFSDIEDKDTANQYSIENLDKIFGDFLYEGESDVATGERRIGTYFAPTPTKYIPGTTSFIVPRIFTQEDGRKEAFSFKPRLLHYVEYKDVDDLQGKKSGTPSTNEWYLEDESGTTQIQTAYPVFHHNENLPADRTITRDLHFGNRNHWPYFQSFVNGHTIRDAVYEYWSFYINELYDIDSRLLTCNVYLKPNEIADIALNDSIFIDGHYYRINKIMGANLTKPESTKVELLKTLPRKSRFPRRRVFDPIDPNDYDDIYVGDGGIFPGGGVRYSKWNDDTIYTGSILEAGYKDKFSVYSGSNEGNWIPQRTNIPSDNVRVVGANYIDERAHNIDIIGSGNQILNNTQNSSIYGNENTITEGTKDIHIYGNQVIAGAGETGSVEDLFIVNTNGPLLVTASISQSILLNPVREITEYDNGKVVSGNTKHQGSYTETYINVPVGPGTTTYLTGSGVDQAFHHHFQWVGVNGNATVFIDDATLAQYDAVQQRFTTDGNLTASKTITLTPVGGTIDGNAEETLSTPYDGFTAQIINGNWLIIQKKG